MRYQIKLRKAYPTSIGLNLSEAIIVDIEDTSMFWKKYQNCYTDLHDWWKQKVGQKQSWTWMHYKLREIRYKLKQKNQFRDRFLKIWEGTDLFNVLTNLTNELMTVVKYIRSSDWKIEDVNVFYSPFKNWRQKLQDATHLVHCETIQTDSLPMKIQMPKSWYSFIEYFKEFPKKPSEINEWKASYTDQV